MPTDLEAEFRQHERYLWSVCYRMTGCAADAEDLVQETFARAIAKPPARTDQPWRPWLVQVAVNLSRDHLRRRKRRAYVGPWLPSPVETDTLLESMPDPNDTEARYEQLESVSYAFLLALELLTPTQRGVLLMRDVLQYSGRETGEALGMSEGNVRITLHRARRALREYDETRCAQSSELREQTHALLARFLTHLAAGDVPKLESLLADDVVAVNDSDGKYLAARLPVLGANKVARFHVGIQHPEAGLRLRLVDLNGLPAVVGEFDTPSERVAPYFVFIGLPDRNGRFRSLHTVVAPRKLGAVPRVDDQPIG